MILNNADRLTSFVFVFMFTWTPYIFGHPKKIPKLLVYHTFFDIAVSILFCVPMKNIFKTLTQIHTQPKKIILNYQKIIP